MNEDHAKGKLNQVAGKLTGDSSQENKGKLQEHIGDVKDAASGLIDKVSDKLGSIKDDNR